uniref:NADH dehydrogenase subunit 2 n=1 Tax=Steinernema carpocapsae TaxID=34508 RepID=A0A1E1G7B3_STECR|nr:NADH dehydrogenase subunit 2 [Steinernema carpocapsae]
MIIFLSFSVFFIFFVNLFTSNILVWWSGFLLMTIIFVFINKNLYCYAGLLNYFIIQEVLGLFFIFSFMEGFQFFFLLMKVGVSPLHFWVFNVLEGVYGWGIMWFLTFQKLPFLPVLLVLVDFFFFVFIVLGIFFCYFQMLILKDYKKLIIISSTESFSWLILVGYFNFFNMYFLFFYYFFLMCFMLPYLNNFYFNFFNWELVLVFLNMPFTFTFFVKIFSLSFIFFYNSFLFLFILFLMFLSMISFSFFLVNLSVMNFSNIQYSLKYNYFFLIPFIFLILI